LLVRHAALFSSVVLIGAQPGLTSAADRAARRADDLKLRRLLEAEGIEAFVDRWEKSPLLATDGRLGDGDRAKQRRERLAHDPKGLARSLAVTGLGEMPAYSSALSDLQVPTTLLAGSLDDKFTRIAEAMATQMRVATVEIVEGAGHNVLLEKPEAIVAAIERSLGRPGEERP
jgi:2-succinyl-6-hydroxy-2,4-cyclohexadiene-1-carboxylate synthase